MKYVWWLVCQGVGIGFLVWFNGVLSDHYTFGERLGLYMLTALAMAFFQISGAPWKETK